ncbi:Lysosomal beta glucosidase [Camellia lanceoleosa]|uniref:Lysosomal beta glucosidase n=1 Tax=Camellia lanceoleosa TaxID=1840588 RepID=A0ACC0GDG7_9ERIC|nr:Lysosomal beta glucosidase [Camellia lanceoleosa]
MNVFVVSSAINHCQKKLLRLRGSILSAGGGGPFEKATSSDWIDMIDRFQNAALESRLRIPLLYGTDAVHGNNNVYDATVFPHNIGLGATRDAELVRRIEVATALEVRACGAQFTFAPCVASISTEQAKRFTKFRERKGLIDKDVVRTDRSLSFYDGDDNPNVK